MSLTFLSFFLVLLSFQIFLISHLFQSTLLKRGRTADLTLLFSVGLHLINGDANF